MALKIYTLKKAFQQSRPLNIWKELQQEKKKFKCHGALKNDRQNRSNPLTPNQVYLYIWYILKIPTNTWQCYTQNPSKYK